jgi:hypothetical protein
MKTMIAIGALGAATLALTGMSSATMPDPAVPQMVSVAYKVPVDRVEQAISILRRDFRVSDADIPQALGILARCGKTGAVEYGDLITAIIATGPAWNASMHSDNLERTFGIRRDGLADVQRLCRALETARKGHGSSPETIASMISVLKAKDQQSVVARSLISGIEIEPVDGIREIRRDYRERIRWES